MKISVTDKFLWDAYIYLEQIGDIVKKVPKSRREFYKLYHGYQNPVFEKYRKEKSKKQFTDFIRWLKVKNYIKVSNLQGRETVMLTKKAIDKAIIAKFKVEKHNYKKRKDGKWIMLIFDIPKQYEKSRKLLRSILENLGYKIFQHSVWINPYDISEKTEELLKFYALDEFVRIFLVDKLD